MCRLQIYCHYQYDIIGVENNGLSIVKTGETAKRYDSFGTFLTFYPTWLEKT